MMDVPHRLRVYQFIRDYQMQYGLSPTYMEIAVGLNLNSGSLYKIIRTLRRMGYLQPGTRKMRCLKVKQVA